MKTLLIILLILFVVCVLIAGFAVFVLSAYAKAITKFYEETHEEL